MWTSRSRSAGTSNTLRNQRNVDWSDSTDTGNAKKGARVSIGRKKRKAGTSRNWGTEGRSPNVRPRANKHGANVKVRSKRIDEDKEKGAAERRKVQWIAPPSNYRPKLAVGTEIRCKDGRALYANASVMKVTEPTKEISVGDQRPDLPRSGGFGDVYKVRRQGTKEFYALKTELNEFNGKKIDRLKLEVAVMSAFASVTDPERKKHFVHLIDKGKTKLFKLIVMQMVGPSVADIRRRTLCNDFTKHTAMYISQQALEGIRDLHLVGFIHRDVKPQNFAIGSAENDTVIYVLDLGIAHRFLDKHTRKHKPPRPKVPFMGTVRYASRNCHRSKEQSRKDDLEAWIYMSIELYSTCALPWRRVTDKHKVLLEKDNFFRAPGAEIYKRVPKGYKRISDYVDNLAYEEEPNYALIQRNLERIIKQEHIKAEATLDWKTANIKNTSNNGDACAKKRSSECVESRDLNIDDQMGADEEDKEKSSPEMPPSEVNLPSIDVAKAKAL